MPHSFALTSQKISRLDIDLPFGNRLVFLRVGGETSVRLVLIRDGKPTYVTPRHEVSHDEIQSILDGTGQSLDLGALKLRGDRAEMVVDFEFLVIPCPRYMWEWQLQQWFQAAQQAS